MAIDGIVCSGQGDSAAAQEISRLSVDVPKVSVRLGGNDRNCFLCVLAVAELAACSGVALSLAAGQSRIQETATKKIFCRGD